MRTLMVVALFSACLYPATPTLADPPAQPPEVNDFEITLFGRIWRVKSYFVQDDLLANPNEDTFLEPEGLAFRNAVLYASGDRESYETDSRLALYDYPAGGPLSFNGFVQMPNTEPEWWGPEGLTFNNSGSGYGSGANDLVSVERDDTGRAGIIDVSSGNVTSKVAVQAPEDVTYLSDQAPFATLTDLAGSIELTYYDESMAPTGASFAIAPGSNGLVSVSPAFGSWFTGTDQDDDVFIVVTKANPGNAIIVYDLTGSQIGSQQGLPLEPKARIPLGGGFYLILPAFGTVEAIAADEANHVLFIGDEENTMIHVLVAGRLAADFDNDGDVDLADYETYFVPCYSGPTTAPGEGCEICDVDRDDDVDLVDFATFQQSYTGSP